MHGYCVGRTTVRRARPDEPELAVDAVSLGVRRRCSGCWRKWGTAPDEAFVGEATGDTNGDVAGEGSSIGGKSRPPPKLTLPASATGIAPRYMFARSNTFGIDFCCEWRDPRPAP